MEFPQQHTGAATDQQLDSMTSPSPALDALDALDANSSTSSISTPITGITSPHNLLNQNPHHTPTPTPTPNNTSNNSNNTPPTTTLHHHQTNPPHHHQQQQPQPHHNSMGMRFLPRERPYSCHVCGKRFTQKAHLIIHKRTHTGEKPYACHICHKRFAQTSHLNVHKRVHTGEKPFFCNFCGMGFCRRPRLETHILQHMAREGRGGGGTGSGGGSGSLNKAEHHAPFHSLTMPGLIGVGAAGMGERVNQESLDAAAQLMELRLKGGGVGGGVGGGGGGGDGDGDARRGGGGGGGVFFPLVKYEPDDAERSGNAVEKENMHNSDSGITSSSGTVGITGGGGRGALLDGNSQHDDRVDESNFEHRRRSDADLSDGVRLGDSTSNVSIRSSSGNNNNNSSNGDMMAVSQPSGLTELTELQKQALLSQTLLMNSPKGQGQGHHQLNSFFASNPHQHHSHHHRNPHHHNHHHHLHQQQQQHMMTGGGGGGAGSGGLNHGGQMAALAPGAGGGLTLTGLVRTNSRVSLIDFTAEDIMQHLLSRDDVKSCDFCCLVFRDPAMYYLHRTMHDKMDVRCCNLCGALLKDKYDFTAHFLNKHT